MKKQISAIIFLYASLCVSTVFAQTSSSQLGMPVNTLPVKPWVSSEKQTAPGHSAVPARSKSEEEAARINWRTSSKTTLQTPRSKPVLQVSSNAAASNPWMPSSGAPENKK